MARKFWIVAFAALFIICLASVADAQRRANPNRVVPAGHGQNQDPGQQNPNPGGSGQGENSGGGGQGAPSEDPPTGTPDGETPAEEVTCDALKGGTPGLYGLCIAFCEAHDADDCVIIVTDEGELDFSQCKKSDRKILDKYRSKMREGDPDMPCLPSTQANEDPENSCPCWSLEQLNSMPFAQYATAIDDTWVDCFDVTEWDYGLSCDYGVTNVSETIILASGQVATVDLGAFGGGDCGEAFCFGVWGCNEGICPDWMPVYDWYFDLTEEEYLNCKDQLQQLQGLGICTP